MSNVPHEKQSFAPGMTMPVVAGQEYTLKDLKGESLVIEGRDDPLTLAFIDAFRSYLVVRALYTADHEQSKKAWQRCLDTYGELPARIIENPVSPSLGITLPTRPL